MRPLKKLNVLKPPKLKKNSELLKRTLDVKEKKLKPQRKQDKMLSLQLRKSDWKRRKPSEFREKREGMLSVRGGKLKRQLIF